MKAIHQFVIELFTRLGIGVSGNIDNINLGRVQELFPNYKFVVYKNETKDADRDVQIGHQKYKAFETEVIVINKETEEVVISMVYTHTASGHIAEVRVN